MISLIVTLAAEDAANFTIRVIGAVRYSTVAS